jgi:16S rRNA (adenine1518-N6/adenine1519-N6)-dimethyltransferase
LSLEDWKLLLREHRIVPNKLLGQNFVVDSSVFPKMGNYAFLNQRDIVLDAGAGFGFLTRFLANRCKQVLAVEKDPRVAQVLRNQVSDLANVTVIEGDVLKAEIPPFNKAVSAPPYYLSSQLVTWLLERKVEYAVLVVQKEFASRLTTPAGSEEYGWLNVMVAQAAETEVLDEVPRWMFHPEPEVDSIILRLRPWATPPFTVKDRALFKRLAKWLFTERNKKLENAVSPFIRTELKMDKAEAAELASALPQRGKRVRELAPKDFGAIADALSK